MMKYTVCVWCRSVVSMFSIILIISNTMRHQGGCLVKQVSFIPGTSKFNEQDLHKILEFFKVPQAGIETVTSKLAMNIFDE